jgi:hypothetical protein
MKKPNAQAERPSKLLTLHVPHDHFFYFLIDYKHKHTAVASELHVPHLPPPPTFLIDYKHKHTATGVASHVSHVRFFLFF